MSNSPVRNKVQHLTIPFRLLDRSAGLVIIGDEILAAKVEDLNTAFLCGELRAIGWRVKQVWHLPN